MKILVLTNLYPPQSVGGYELRCRATVQGLKALGHQCHVVTSDFYREELPEVKEAGIDRSLQLIGFFGRPWVSAPALFDIEAQNCQILQRAVEKFQPDVIHCWNLGGLGKCLLRQAEELAPLVTDISDHWVIRARRADPLDNWYRRHPVLRRIWPRAQRGLPHPTEQMPLGRPYFTSAALRDLTAAAGYPVADAPVVHCGVDYQSMEHAVIAPEPIKRCGYVGRLHPDKGVDTACEAVAELDSDLQLDVWGEGLPLMNVISHRAGVIIRGFIFMAISPQFRQPVCTPVLSA